MKVTEVARRLVADLHRKAQEFFFRSTRKLDMLPKFAARKKQSETISNRHAGRMVIRSTYPLKPIPPAVMLGSNKAAARFARLRTATPPRICATILRFPFSRLAFALTDLGGRVFDCRTSGQEKTSGSAKSPIRWDSTISPTSTAPSAAASARRQAQ